MNKFYFGHKFYPTDIRYVVKDVENKEPKMFINDIEIPIVPNSIRYIKKECEK